MSCRLFAAVVLGALLGAGARAEVAGLVGRMDGDTYVSPTGEFRFPSPVLPELGGTVSDTANVVTFSDNFNVHISIACFPQDATQKWELETRERRDYLLYFFTTFVLADFQARFPGAKIESARYVPGLMDGALIAYALLPGGSAFETRNRILGTPDADPVTAKRGNLLFVRRGHVYIVSTELAERVTERSTYALTPEKEDALLSDRLTTLAGRFVFTAPKPRGP
ncbi:MAG TPA: hypothetical protein VHD61_15960 [Lacunisphaera sp.]|nr:hypothetical protein [Lacunisphaera sp.]